MGATGPSSRLEHMIKLANKLTMSIKDIVYKPVCESDCGKLAKCRKDQTCWCSYGGVWPACKENKPLGSLQTDGSRRQLEMKEETTGKPKNESVVTNENGTLSP